MASDPIPSVFFGNGYTTGTDYISLATESGMSPLLEELTDAEADPTTGDYRKIIFALMEMLNAKFLAVDPVPGKISVDRSSYEDTTNNELVRTYTVQIRTVVTGVEVADETP